MKVRQAPMLPDRGPMICRLCGKLVPGRGPQAKWHPGCYTEAAPAWDKSQVRPAAHAMSEGRCEICGKHHDLDAHTWEADHREALWKAGGDIRFWCRSNLQVLCVEPCHADKTAEDAAAFRAVAPSARPR